MELMNQKELNLNGTMQPERVHTPPCPVVKSMKSSAHESRAIRDLIGLLQGSSYTSLYKG